ncbi:MAG: tol-pal system protein YbgF [Pseudomonadota bacterium]
MALKHGLKTAVQEQVFNKYALKKKNNSKAQGIYALCLSFIFILTFAGQLSSALAQDSVNNRLNRLENKLETLNRAVYTGDFSQAPRQIYNTTNVKQDDASTAQMEIRLQQIETQMRTLTGKLEEQLYTINQLRLDVQRLQNVPITQNSSSLMNDNPVAQPQIEPLEQPVQDPEPEKDNNSLFGIDLTAQEPQGMNLASPIRSRNDATASYEQAFRHIKDKEFLEARAAFEEFLLDHPNHVLTANAKYWLGETFYAEGEFKQAARIFAEGFQSYPDTPKSPDMLLKLGLSLSNLGKKDEACITLSQLPIKFQSGPEAILERGADEINRLNCTI